MDYRIVYVSKPWIYRIAFTYNLRGSQVSCGTDKHEWVDLIYIEVSHLHKVTISVQEILWKRGKDLNVIDRGSITWW